MTSRTPSAPADVGWLQIYVEDVQDAMDATLQAYKIAEDPAIRTPIMVCMDGFILTACLRAGGAP